MSTFWLYTIDVHHDAFWMDSRELMRRLLEAGIQSRPLFQPLHLSAAHADADDDGCEVAERLYASGLSIPCSVRLGEQDQDRVIETVGAAAEAAGRG